MDKVCKTKEEAEEYIKSVEAISINITAISKIASLSV